MLQIVELPADRAEAVERELRAAWGGERPYIPKLGELGRRLMSVRDEQIRAEHRRGERVKFLSRRWQLAPQHIRRIVAAGVLLPDGT